IAGRIFGRMTGFIALVVGAAAPMWVFYSQEVRPYAFTPLLMLLMVEAVFEIQTAQLPSNRRPWLKLITGEVLSLYAHGFMVFAGVAINSGLAILWIRRLHSGQFWIFARNWAISQIAALVLIIPSIPTYLGRTSGFRNPFVPQLTFAEYANEMWAYFMGIPK